VLRRIGSGGRESMMRLDSDEGQIVRWATDVGGSDLIIDKKPSAIPVLLRRVESLTFSCIDISDRRSFPHLDGKVAAQMLCDISVLELTHTMQICSSAL